METIVRSISGGGVNRNLICGPYTLIERSNDSKGKEPREKSGLLHQRVTRPAYSRSGNGVINGDILIRDEVIVKPEEEGSKKQAIRSGQSRSKG